MTALDLQVGQALGIRPEGEGPAPVLVGGGFEVFFFYGGLSREEVQGFATGAVSCGVYVEDAIPVLVLDIENFGGLEVAFNIFVEPEEKRRQFFEAAPGGSTAHIVLCDHPGSVVQAVRLIRPGVQVISEIKKACFDQLTLYRNLSQCFQAMARIYDAISPEEMRRMVTMRPA
ncbi:hypothetical protein [Fundidesulfovibrio agrisoli]|uniref:hypothetical protein n=1 Tax=Fundidesulfovibrio agrisoli TaxID=2922717 RepID=UPI001FAE11F0|nr:hypothetical protein [Fundidesulfovibrio agrisoli]